MGQIIQAKKDAKQRKEGKIKKQGNWVELPESKEKMKVKSEGTATFNWLNTFFVDSLYVVAPGKDKEMASRMKELIDEMHKSQNESGSTGDYRNGSSSGTDKKRKDDSKTRRNNLKRRIVPRLIVKSYFMIINKKQVLTVLP